MPAALRPCSLGILIVALSLTGFADVTAQQRAQASKLNNLGVAYMNQQRMDKAIDEFGEAYKINPSLATAEMNKGIALLNVQKYPEAGEALEAAAAKIPDNPRVWYNLGLLRRGEGKTQEAIDAFQKVLKLDPNDPDTHYFLGTMYSQEQQYDKAIPEFEAALKLKPLNASAEFGLARALQRSGKTAEARSHLQTFEHLTKTKISSPITLTYGEQGRYSTAQDVISTEPQVGPMIPVKLVSQPLGATTTSTARTQPAGSRKESNQANITLPPGGMCMIDIDGDGRVDLLQVDGRTPPVHIFRNSGAGKWKEMPAADAGLDLKGQGVSCAVGDFDSDGKNDLAIAMSDRVLLFRNLGNGKFADVTKAAGIPEIKGAWGMTFVDYDHDGDLDLFVMGAPRPAPPDSKSTTYNYLLRNNGDKTFTDWTEQAGLAFSSAQRVAMLSDINNDRAVDLVAGGNGVPTAYINPREGPFQPLPIYNDATLPPSVGVTVFDFNKDGWMDIAVTHAGGPGLTLWRNVDGKRFERVPLPATDATGGFGLTAVDIDNDGWLDLAAVLETPRGHEVHVFRNLGAKGFEDVSSQLGLDKLKLDSPLQIIAGDFEGNAAADLIVSQLSQDPVILHNEGGNKNHSLRIDLKGLADNKTALGTKVEVFAGGLWQKFEIPGNFGYLTQGSPEILAGLGSNEHADIVRMLWPTGVLQDEIELAGKKDVSFTELDRRGSSCPTLFAWNGDKYEFIADVIGAGVMGHWISPTARNIPDPDEWIKIEGSQLRERDGYLSLRFGEPMEEVNFVDQLRLVAIDHPADTEAYPDEKFLDNPPFATGKPVLTSAPRPPVGAWDDQGRDVLALLTYRDHQYVRDFHNAAFAGFANQHTLTLDLGPWTARNPLRLFLSGYIEYFSASSLYSAWQAGQQPISPYIEAQMPDGSWKRVIDDMGFPAGLPRTVTVDLTGKLPEGTRRIRIVTNLQIYWDQVQVDNGPQRANQLRTTELRLALATLGFRGYPQQVDGATPGDLTYFYDRASLTGPFARERGSYTRYGEVTPLLKKVDDQFVIFGTGEDIDAEFSAATLPPLPPGWKRDYFFYANGYVKDMDFYEASPFTVAQVPFHGMSRYPYPETQHFPEGAESAAYWLNWNDRYESGTNHAWSYRFVYGPRTIDPEPLIPHGSSQANASDQVAAGTGTTR